jgi:hypothetical protein
MTGLNTATLDQMHLNTLQMSEYLEEATGTCYKVRQRHRTTPRADRNKLQQENENIYIATEGIEIAEKPFFN